MKLAGYFLLIITLILGSVVADDRSDEDWIKNRKLKAICFLRYPNDNEETLRRNCRHSKEINVLDEEARANVTILSRFDRGVVLNFEPAIYIVEGRTEDGTWRFVETLPQNNDPDHLQTTWRYQMDHRDTNVQLRFYRAFSTGISRPETIQIGSRRRSMTEESEMEVD